MNFLDCNVNACIKTQIKHQVFKIDKNFYFILPVKPTGLDLDIGEAVKENTEKSVQCKAYSANPASSVGMEFFINGKNQRDILPEIIETPGSDNGIIKTLVFMFESDRNQNGRSVRCRLLWDGTYIQKYTEGTLNITCE